MNAPEVKGYGDLRVEPYENYLARWPADLNEFPKCLIENWVYRHWSQFRDEWMHQGALSWKYELKRFSNEEIMSIAHFENTLKTMDYWGKQLFIDKSRQETWLARYMLTAGTSPAPILVLNAGANVRHPRAHKGEKILEPFQIIEGHMRLSYLRGMIQNQYKPLKDSHNVWVADANT